MVGVGAGKPDGVGLMLDVVQQPALQRISGATSSRQHSSGACLQHACWNGSGMVASSGD